MPDPLESEVLAWPGAVQASWPDEGVAVAHGSTSLATAERDFLNHSVT